MRRCSSMTSSLSRVGFNLVIILFVLLALLPLRALMAIDTTIPDGQIYLDHDTLDSVALGRFIDEPKLFWEAAYFPPEEVVCLRVSSIVSANSYRGPPVPA